MANNRIRITKILRVQENKLKSQGTNEALEAWLRLSIEDLELRLRYSKEETQTVQGALRALDDLSDILSND